MPIYDLMEGNLNADKAGSGKNYIKDLAKADSSKNSASVFNTRFLDLGSFSPVSDSVTQSLGTHLPQATPPSMPPAISFPDLPMKQPQEKDMKESKPLGKDTQPKYDATTDFRPVPGKDISTFLSGDQWDSPWVRKAKEEAAAAKKAQGDWEEVDTKPQEKAVDTKPQEKAQDSSSSPGAFNFIDWTSFGPNSPASISGA